MSSLFEAFEGTVLYVSHDIDEALRFCDRIAVIEKGHVMEVDTGNELVNNPHSTAGIKLSGCKNATPCAENAAIAACSCPHGAYRSKPMHRCPTIRSVWVFAPSSWNAPKAPAATAYQVRVVRTSDSRFDRTVLLEFSNRAPEADAVVKPDGKRNGLPGTAPVLACGQAESRRERPSQKGRRAVDSHSAR